MEKFSRPFEGLCPGATIFSLSPLGISSGLCYTILSHFTKGCVFMSQRPARRRGRGRRALLILLLLTVFGAAFLWWSNRSLQVDRFTYASPRLPAGFDGCVAVQLSDLHGA